MSSPMVLFITGSMLHPYKVYPPGKKLHFPFAYS